MLVFLGDKSTHRAETTIIVVGSTKLGTADLRLTIAVTILGQSHFPSRFFSNLALVPNEIVFLRSPNFLKAMVRGSAVMTGGWSNCSSLGIW